jgi:aspartate/methionine/tyrosine aminotransferase
MIPVILIPYCKTRPLQELIYMAMRCLAEPGDHIVAPFPAYQSLYENLTSIGCHVDKWEPQLLEAGSGTNGGIDRSIESEAPTESRWHFSLATLKLVVKPTTKLIVVNFPHNPTGFVPEGEDWNQIVEFCRERNIFLFSDEMYKFLDNLDEDDEDGTSLPSDCNIQMSLPSACDLYDRSMTLFGVSKSLSLPGLRIGWLVTRDVKVMEKLKSFKGELQDLADNIHGHAKLPTLYPLWITTPCPPCLLSWMCHPQAGIH